MRRGRTSAASSGVTACIRLARASVRSQQMAGQDNKTYDVANFFFAVTEETGTNAIGKLWVEYDVEFFVPQLSPTAAISPVRTSFYQQHAAESFTTATPKAVAWDTLTYDALGWGAGSAGVFTPPAGAYVVQAVCTFTDSANETFTAVLEILKNGSSLSTAIKEEEIDYGGVGGALTTTPINGVVTCNGTDTIQIKATLTGAAGTITSVADMCSLIVQPA